MPRKSGNYRDDPVKVVEGIREEIEQLRLKRSSITTARLSKPEAIARIDQWLDESADEFNHIQLLGNEFSSPGGLEIRPFRIGGGSRSGISLGPLLAAVFRDSVREAVIEALPEDDGIPLSDRPKLVEEIDKAIFNLELAEEDLIEQAENDGVDIPRRPDASPEAVLRVNWQEGGADEHRA